MLIKSNSPEPVSVFVRIRPLIAEEVEDGDQPLQGSCCLYFDSNLTWLMVTGVKIDLLLTFARDVFPVLLVMILLWLLKLSRGQLVIPMLLYHHGLCGHEQNLRYD